MKVQNKVRRSSKVETEKLSLCTTKRRITVNELGRDTTKW